MEGWKNFLHGLNESAQRPDSELKKRGGVRFAERLEEEDGHRKEPSLKETKPLHGVLKKRADPNLSTVVASALKAASEEKPAKVKESKVIKQIEKRRTLSKGLKLTRNASFEAKLLDTKQMALEAKAAAKAKKAKRIAKERSVSNQ
eukprot:Blabericola_migrator_1__8027@NODE_411_length_8732_cov_37_171725_g324_i0_p8_GENE_NODE_411_length_8732_cov_37_171725_g324_i0NODE_411_length_8732_cov_37_171725_g324_i0_p8_ORF_typecomplete_len146_score37_15_NODE_411_length_8732_cov_37_171725_g324_i077638200